MVVQFSVIDKGWLTAKADTDTTTTVATNECSKSSGSNTLAPLPLLDVSSTANITHLFISDLHLSPDEPALMQAFLALLDTLINARTASNSPQNQWNNLANHTADNPSLHDQCFPHSSWHKLKALYILGDWFEAWLGDDSAMTPTLKAWLAPMLSRLATLIQQGCQIFVMRGNRDFLLGQDFCQCFGGQLLDEPHVLTFTSANANQMWRIRLEHGDALCTTDVAYQRFRRFIRHPFTTCALLALPVSTRLHIAQRLRNASQIKHRQSLQPDSAYKPFIDRKKISDIMDVTPSAVTTAMQGIDVLIHGHTHRPCVHAIVEPIRNNSVHQVAKSDKPTKQRIVLGDWRVNMPLHDQLSDDQALDAQVTAHQKTSSTSVTATLLGLCDSDAIVDNNVSITPTQAATELPAYIVLGFAYH